MYTTFLDCSPISEMRLFVILMARGVTPYFTASPDSVSWRLHLCPQAKFASPADCKHAPVVTALHCYIHNGGVHKISYFNV